MKKTIIFLLSAVLFFSCKKDPELSLKSKWTVDNIIAKEYLNGTLANTTTVPGGGTTLDFQDNGNVIITSPGSPVESFPYTLQSNSKVVFDGDTYDIKNLTGSTVILFIREDFGSGDYDETSINLKK